MSNLDIATGLPELPANCRWRVAEHYESHPGWYQAMRTGKLVIRIESAVTTTSTAPRRRWRRTPASVTSTTWERAPHSTDVVVQGTAPIAILNAARRSLSLWEKANLRAELIGVYPPKKLNITTEAQQ